MRRALTRISLLVITLVISISMCTLTPAFADDSQQSDQVLKTQSIAVGSTQPMGIGVYPVYYRVINVKALTPQWKQVGVSEGIPTMILGIVKTESISVTYSATFGATYKQINAAVGWTYGTSTSISIEGRYPVPTSYDGRNVKSAKLIAEAKINVKSYQVEKHNEVGGIELSTGIAKKAENYVRYKVILTYVDGGSVTISV